MKCFVCGTEMRLDQTAGEEGVSASGLEHRTFRCPSCGDVEQRLVFRAERNAGAPGLSGQSSAIASRSTDEQPAAPAAEPVKKLSGMYSRLKRLLPFRRETAVPSGSAVTATPTDQQLTSPVESIPPAASSTPTFAHPAEREAEPVEGDDKLDECAALLQQAIELVHAPARSPEPQIQTELQREAPDERAIEVAPEPVAAPQILVEPSATKPPAAREPEPPLRKVVAVEIHYDPVRARYAAKDSTTGLLVMRHEDRTRLKGMCERMGWQVIERPAGA